jgi:hypothetical protein
MFTSVAPYGLSGLPAADALGDPHRLEIVSCGSSQIRFDFAQIPTDRRESGLFRHDSHAAP